MKYNIQTARFHLMPAVLWMFLCAGTASAQGSGKPAIAPEGSSKSLSTPEGKNVVEKAAEEKKASERALDGPAAYLANDVDYENLVSKIHVVDIKTKISGLPEKERSTARKLLEIIPHINSIYRRQRSGELGDKIVEALIGQSTPRAKAALKLSEMNSGPYDPWQDNAARFHVPPYPKNGFAYPEDLTKAEFDAYVQKHPEQKNALYSPYSVITRGLDNALRVRYYHEAYAAEVQTVARLLTEASQLAADQNLKAFLKSKAADLLDDNYVNSYGNWISMKGAPLDLVVGPAESYEDSITNVKQNFTYALYTKDDQGADVIAKFVKRIPDLGRDLPVDKRYNPYLRDKGFKPARNMEAVNMIALGGESLTYTAAGWTLPNEPEIVARHGTKMLLIRNVIATRGFEAMDFAQRALFDEPYDPQAFYWLVAGHELSHGMLPLTKQFDPKGQALNEILGDLTMPVEEQKADLLGMVALEHLAEAGDISWAAYWAVARMYVGADTIFSYYRNPNEAHAKYKMVVYNMLKEAGAVEYSGKNGHLKVNKNFPKAMRDITAIFLKIEAEADKAAAESLLKEKNAIAAEVGASIEALKKANLPSRTYYNAIIED